MKEQPLESEYARDYQNELERELLESESSVADTEEPESEPESVSGEIDIPGEEPLRGQETPKIILQNPQAGPWNETRQRSFTVSVVKSQKSGKISSTQTTADSKGSSSPPRSYASLDALPQCARDPFNLPRPHDSKNGFKPDNPLAKMFATSIKSLLNLPALSLAGTGLPEIEDNSSAETGVQNQLFKIPQTFTFKTTSKCRDGQNEQSESSQLNGSTENELNLCINTVTGVTTRITDQQQELGILTRAKCQSAKNLCPSLFASSFGDNLQFANGNSKSMNPNAVPLHEVPQKNDLQPHGPAVMDRSHSYSLLVLPQVDPSKCSELPQNDRFPIKSPLSRNSSQSDAIKGLDWDMLQKGLLDLKWDSHSQKESDEESDTGSTV